MLSRAAYEPGALFARFEHQIAATYAHRFVPPRSVKWADLKRGLAILARVVWTCGVRSSYRREFWAFAWPRFKLMDIERVIAVGVVAHHLISFAGEASQGRQNASFYSHKRVRPEPASARVLAPADAA